MNVSVIIPAFNAEKTIGRTLHALKGQTRRSSIEIIVVDDGSTDSTKKIVRSFRRIKLIGTGHRGPAAARNLGARLAKGEILVFTDSDCEAQPTFVAELLKPFKDPKVAGVQGAYQTRQTSWVARFGQVEIEERYERMKRQPAIDWIGTYAAAYRKKDFWKADGFDEKYPRASGEDPDLSYALAEKGKKLVFNPKAITFHQHPESFWKYVRTKFYRGVDRVRLYGKFPKKMVSDSYTPQELKLQVGLTYAFWMAVIASMMYPILVGTILVIFGLFLGTTKNLMEVAERRAGWRLALLTPIMVGARSFAFASGLLWGLAWRK